MPKHQKIPVEDYARRHGWRKSAVVHRIRAGIYDGVREGNRWYVIVRAPGSDVEAADPGAMGDADRYRPAAAARPPRLPWPIVEGPFRWVTWLLGAVAILMIVAHFRLRLWELSLLPAALGMTLVGGAMVYEALRTGVVRARGPLALAERPFLFSVMICVYLFLVSVGVVSTVAEIFKLVR